MKFFTLILAFSLVTSVSVNAQPTVLGAGDLLFTGFNTNPAAGTPDTFCIIFLVPVNATTVIYFSDRGYNGSGWQGSGGTEGTVAWTVGANIPFGTQVRIAGLGASAAQVNATTSNGVVTQVAGGNAVSGLSIGNGGDQIQAFQGGGGDPTSGSAVRIAGIHFSTCTGTSDATWDPVACASGPSASAMMPGLVGGTSAFWAGAFQTQGRYNCTGGPLTTASDIRTAVMNRSNWVFSNNQFSTVIGPAFLACGSTLPLKLLSFQSVETGTGTQLRWVTTEEVNTQTFYIERSADGQTFENIGSVPAVNNTGASEQEYYFPLTGVNTRYYYRLKMQDIDGQFTYSWIITIDADEARNDFILYPNPATGDDIFISSGHFLDHSVQVQLVDMNGKIWFAGKAEPAQLNNSRYRIPVRSLSSGVYVIRISDIESGKSYSMRFNR